MSGDLIHGLSDASYSYGVFVDLGCPAMTYVDNITLDAIYASIASGVHVARDCGLSLRNAIVSGVTGTGADRRGTGVDRAGENLPLAVTVSYTALWDNDTDLGDVVEGAGVIRQDPQFSQQPLPYALEGDSPCVDAGDPDAPCGEEPVDADGQCRMDMGHLGNTADARAAE
jgi:hypothetical protein